MTVLVCHCQAVDMLHGHPWDPKVLTHNDAGIQGGLSLDNGGAGCVRIDLSIVSSIDQNPPRC